jgi:hypothetical protein
MGPPPSGRRLSTSSRQYLYFCTRKASKLYGASPERPQAVNLLASVFVLLYSSTLRTSAFELQILSKLIANT